MADDPIQAALREAALRVAAEQCDGVVEADQRACIAGGVCTCRTNAAAAIAAFLRALPAQFTTGCTAWGGDWPTLAAAAERAARTEGARDG